MIIEIGVFVLIGMYTHR